MSSLAPSTKREKRIAASSARKATAAARRRNEARKLPTMLFQMVGAGAGGMFARGSNIKGVPSGIIADAGVSLAGLALGVNIPKPVQDVARGWGLGALHSYAASRPDARNVFPW